MKIFIQKERNTALHYNMSLLGGFLGTYTLLLRGGNFGSAQTGNFLETMISLSEKNFAEVGIRIGAAVVYAVSLIISYILTNYSKTNMKKLVLIVEAIGLCIAAFIPLSADPVLALYPIFAIMSFQWGTYSGSKGYNSASVFMTNNFKQSVLGWTRFFFEHDPKEKEKACLYTTTVVSFLIGAFLGCISVYQWGRYAAFAGLLPLLTAWIILSYKSEK